MKTLRKLIPSLGLLLLAASLFASSTFAWFSMNTTVSASGLSVTAQAPESLLISLDDSDDSYGASVTLDSDTSVAGYIVPCVPNTKQKFVRLTSKGKASVTETGAVSGAANTAIDTFIAGSATTVPTNDYYEATTTDYFQDDVYIKLTGSEATKNLTVTASYTDSLTADAEDIKEAMHLLFVISGTVVADLSMADEGTETTLCDITGGGDTIHIYIYYYLDGEDANCYNGNITQDTDLPVDLTFGLSAKDAD